MKKALKMTLMVDGKEKTFTEKFIPAKRILEALDLISSDPNQLMTDIFEDRVKFLANVFTDKEVTEDLIWEGFNALDFDDQTFNLICGVAGVDPKRVRTEPVKE
ncbi:phage tail assembly chaperone G [Pediococcus acidilactici]|uniref:phage tail assembly chaperone G n=1 Tax=Pediococcus acidilactici TaxID=1254 RepID=UPI003B42D4D4